MEALCRVQPHAVDDRMGERSVKPDRFEADPLKFAALMAHQMQSPLNAVSTLLQSILSEYSGPLLPQQRSALEKANLRCQQAVSSVRRMLAIIQSQTAAAQELRCAAVMDTMRQVHAQFVPEAAQHDIALLLEVAAEPGYVPLDEASLNEVVGALVSNAIKYTPEHGRVRISVSPDPAAGRLRISVEDSGAGVPEKDRDHIFEPFFRTPAARYSGRPGVGLGLSLVKSVIHAAGGSVAVGKSELGGAEFTIELPSAPEPEAAAGQGRTPAMRVVIIGGVAAGPKAASKIIRLVPDADVTIVDKGTVLSYAGCGLPHYISGLVKDQRRLISSPAGTVRDPVFFRSVKNIHVMNRTEALEIDRAGRRVRIRDCLTGRESWLPYDKLLLSTGASPNVPVTLSTDLENVFTLHGFRDAEGIRSVLAENKARDIVIVGGGLLGIEMTQSFVSRGARVTILEKRAHILPILDDDMAALLEQHLEASGVKVVVHTKATALHGRDGKVSEVVTEHGVFPADMVILAVGVHPNVQLARDADLAIGDTGAIAVSRQMQTSDPDIFAAGDCAETVHLLTGRPHFFPLGSTASKQGRVAAMSICGREDAFPGVLGSCICRVFDYNIARTGLGEEEAKALGYQTMYVYAPGPDREHFMPDAAFLLLKLIVDRSTRRLLGVQATGRGAADKRVDVAAMAIRAGMTVDEIAAADLCYAPHFSPAMDNLITAANVARNKLDGLMQGIRPSEVHAMLERREDFLFLDVRTPEEHERIRLPRSIHAPLGSLRSRAAELPADKLAVTFCDISLRAYEASLILRQAGFSDVRVMDGGIAMWPYEKLV